MWCGWWVMPYLDVAAESKPEALDIDTGLHCGVCGGSGSSISPLACVQQQ